MENIKLKNGYELPNICYGTDIVMYSSTTLGKIKRFLQFIVRKLTQKDNQKYIKSKRIEKCIKNSISRGCIFFDTSRAYGGAEEMLGKALLGYKREKYFICTKLDNYSQLNDIPAREVLMKSMKNLNVDYVDVYLLHWPVEGKYLEYWKQLEELYEEGLVRAIGVSNCKIHHLEEIKKIASIMPMVNEVELHPLLSEVELRNYCRDNDIQIMAYTSTARMDFRLRTSKRLEEICKESKKNLSQIILRWHIQNGVIPVFNTTDVNHLVENMNIFDFCLSEVQMKTLDSININSRTRYDSDNCEFDRL